jgi:hypothetical protein
MQGTSHYLPRREAEIQYSADYRRIRARCPQGVQRRERRRLEKDTDAIMRTEAIEDRVEESILEGSILPEELSHY